MAFSFPTYRKFNSCMKRKKKEPAAKGSSSRRKKAPRFWSSDDRVPWIKLFFFFISSMIKKMELMSAQQKQDGRILREMREDVTKISMKVAEDESFKCKFQGPISNLQICVDGSNNMAIHSSKELPVEMRDPFRRKPDALKYQPENDGKISSLLAHPANSETTSLSGCHVDNKDSGYHSCPVSNSDMDHDYCHGNFQKDASDVDGQCDENCLNAVSEDDVPVNCHCDDLNETDGYQNDQVCQDHDVCVDDSKIHQDDQDYHTDVNSDNCKYVLSSDELLSIDDGGVVSGLSEFSVCNLSEEASDDNSNRQSSVSEGISLGQDTAFKSFQETDKTMRSNGCKGGAVTEVSEGLDMPDIAVNAEVVDGLNVPGREMNPIMSDGVMIDTGQAVGDSSEAGCNVDSGMSTEPEICSDVHTLMSKYSCSDVSENPQPAKRLGKTSDCSLKSAVSEQESQPSPRFGLPSVTSKPEGKNMINQPTDNRASSLSDGKFYVGKGQIEDDSESVGNTQFHQKPTYCATWEMEIATCKHEKSVSTKRRDIFDKDDISESKRSLFASLTHSVQTGEMVPTCKRGCSADYLQAGNHIPVQEAVHSAGLPGNMYAWGDIPALEKMVAGLSDGLQTGGDIPACEKTLSASLSDVLQTGSDIPACEKMVSAGLSHVLQTGGDIPACEKMLSAGLSDGLQAACNVDSGGSLSISLPGRVQAGNDIVKTTGVFSGLSPGVVQCVNANSETMRRFRSLPVCVQRGDEIQSSDRSCTEGIACTGRVVEDKPEPVGSSSASLPFPIQADHDMP